MQISQGLYNIFSFTFPKLQYFLTIKFSAKQDSIHIGYII